MKKTMLWLPSTLLLFMATVQAQELQMDSPSVQFRSPYNQAPNNQISNPPFYPPPSPQYPTPPPPPPYGGCGPSGMCGPRPWGEHPGGELDNYPQYSVCDWNPCLCQPCTY